MQGTGALTLGLAQCQASHGGPWSRARACGPPDSGGPGSWHRPTASHDLRASCCQPSPVKPRWYAASGTEERGSREEAPARWLPLPLSGATHADGRGRAGHGLLGPPVSNSSRGPISHCCAAARYSLVPISEPGKRRKTVMKDLSPTPPHEPQPEPTSSSTSGSGEQAQKRL